MRLMYFTPLLSTVGGQERTLTDKANYLVGKGHEVIIVTYEHEGPLAYPLARGVRHEDLHCHFFMLYHYPIWRRPLELLRIKRMFRSRFRQVVNSFMPDLIVIPIPCTENFICDVMAVAGKIPVVIESHLAYGYSVVKRGITEKWLYYFQSPLRAVRRARLLVTLTQGDAHCWMQQGVKRVKVVPNPVTNYPTVLNHQSSGVHPRIICVGRLTPQKRFDRLIEAFSLVAERYPQWRVDIFGDGEDREKLQQLIDSKGLSERILLRHAVSDIYTEYQRSQFFVLSSDFEGFGLVVIEAMACGIPVVSTDCPYGPSEIIEDGKTGLLAKMDVQDLADKMEWMMTHEAERQLMGNEARLASARYQLEIVMPAWEQAYASVL